MVVGHRWLLVIEFQPDFNLYRFGETYNSHMNFSYLDSSEMTGEFVSFDEVIGINNYTRAVRLLRITQSVIVSRYVGRYSVSLHLTGLTYIIVLTLAFSCKRGKLGLIR